MRTKDEDGKVAAFLAYDKAGTLVWAGITNAKGARKSLEQKELWVLDGETGRLLGLADLDGRFMSRGYVTAVHEKDGLYVAELDLPRAGGTEQVPGAGKPQASPAFGPPGVSPDQGGAEGGRGGDSVLLELEALIEKRKKELPEGSYTTHLFKSGLSKIRKKTGEEAVELILAQTPQESLSEAADLLYHLLVLLSALDLSIKDVLVELKKR